MMTFTYITAAIIAVGLICAFIPHKWYNKSSWNFRIGGIWLIMLTLGAQLSIWGIYGLITLVKFLFFTYILAWGNSI